MKSSGKFGLYTGVAAGEIKYLAALVALEVMVMGLACDLISH